MFKDIGVDRVIIGHAEQRSYFGETDETVNRKIKKVLSLDMGLIVCIGETLAERQGGKLESVLRTQVNGAYAGLSGDEAQEAQEAHALVRGLLAKLFGDDVAQSISIQYGGSMKPENAAGLLGQSDIDGGLIGGAALKADSFDSFLGIVTPGESISK